jgi:RNA-directed DNA polymerase
MKRLAISLLQIAERNNLLLAVHKAARGKRQRPAVARFLADLDAQLNNLAASILDGSAPLGQYSSFTIYDPKCRQIHAACFADRVLHHACMNLAEPRFEKMLVDSSYACRPGKGVHAAAVQVQRNLRRFAWAVQVDVAGYFPSICHASLKALLATRFKGADFLALLGRIIDSGSVAGAGHGLPIGALTSQHFANAYLDAADRWLLAHESVRAHLRYMDDIVWFVDDRRAAEDSLQEFAQYLWQSRGLHLKANARIVPCVQGLNYCGFRVRQGVILPSQRKMARYRQHFSRIEAAYDLVDDLQMQSAADSALAALAQSASLVFRQNYWRRVGDPPTIVVNV